MSTRSALAVTAAVAALLCWMAWQGWFEPAAAVPEGPEHSRPNAPRTAEPSAPLELDPSSTNARTAAEIDATSPAQRAENETRPARDTDAMRLRGTARTLAGTPLSKFEVVLRSQSGASEEHAYAFEDAAGRFDIPDAKPGSWDVFARAEGFLPRVQPIVLPPEPHGLELVVSPLVRVRGRVVDAAGAGVAEATVRLPDEDAALGPWTSAPDGAFELFQGADRAFSLTATHPEYARSEPVIVEILGSREPAPVVLRLRSGATVTGELLHADGAPDRGQTVVLMQLAGLSMEADSDDLGEFRFERVPPGAYLLLADEDVDAAGRTRLRVASVTAEDGGSYHFVLGGIRPSSVLVRGQLLRRGQPAANVTKVVVFREGPGLFASAVEADVREQARFELALDEPGEYVVVVRDNSIRMSVPEQPVFDVRLELPAGKITGRVQDTAGAGVRTRVWIVLEERWSPWRLDDVDDERTGEDGSFEFEDLEPGTYSLHSNVTPPLYSVELAAGQDVDGLELLALAPSRVEGRVIDEQGQPVPGAYLFAQTQRGEWFSPYSATSSDASGRFTLKLPAGRYVLHARGSEHVSRSGTAVEVGANRPARIDVAVVGGGWLHVRTTDESGSPCAARVSVTDENGLRPSQLSSRADFETFLRFGYAAHARQFGPLAPGHYVVEAVFDGGRRRERVRLRTGERRDVVLARPAAGE